MIKKEIQKEIVALDGSYSIKVDLSIPLGYHVVVPIEDDFVDNILINQVTNGLKQAIREYQSSELPERFITGQRYVITNSLPDGILGAYDIPTDEIYFDADMISGIMDVKPTFILGHEVGHKITRYRKMDDALMDIASVLGVGLFGNEKTITEIFCDEFGNIAAGTDYDRGLLRTYIEPERRKYIHKKILYNLYK